MFIYFILSDELFCHWMCGFFLYWLRDGMVFFKALIIKLLYWCIFPLKQTSRFTLRIPNISAKITSNSVIFQDGQKCSFIISVSI